ncbi:DUF6249 domain-containing protein [Algoriphagus hitonicola]|uniref:DUF6249 domain-containing protein n=1 Tax=Algoriphagus hitonicola TaxID=435880 RepID=A0A1I2NJZ2_9BACT|nr:DUF6249 domain-containing protein [Algoriphagus hitonicola]SFG02017.1 hypothetical protein SAMN04487988_10163 [Algoriphagus hitonicola]
MASDILIPFFIFSSIFGIAYVYFTTRNKERLALIEKGADARLFNSGKRFSFGEIILNLALLSIGIGVGVLVGAMLEQGGMDSDVSFPASIFIFAGIGLTVSFFVNRKLSQSES